MCQAWSRWLIHRVASMPCRWLQRSGRTPLAGNPDTLTRHACCVQESLTRRGTVVVCAGQSSSGELCMASWFEAVLLHARRFEQARCSTPSITCTSCARVEMTCLPRRVQPVLRGEIGPALTPANRHGSWLREARQISGLDVQVVSYGVVDRHKVQKIRCQRGYRMHTSAAATSASLTWRALRTGFIFRCTCKLNGEGSTACHHGTDHDDGTCVVWQVDSSYVKRCQPNCAAIGNHHSADTPLTDPNQHSRRTSAMAASRAALSTAPMTRLARTLARCFSSGRCSSSNAVTPERP